MARQRQKKPWGYIDSTALSFYNAKLRDDLKLRRSCSDRHVFDATVDQWKAEHHIKGVSRSSIIFSLRKKKIINSKFAEENVIIWEEDIDVDEKDGDGNSGGGQHRSNVEAIRIADSIKETVDRIRNSRQELESDRNGIIIGNIEWEDDVLTVGQPVTSQSVSIRNESAVDVICKINDNAAKQRGFLVGDGGLEISAGGGSSYFDVSFRPKQIGITKSIIVFEFSPINVEEGAYPSDSFSIVRYISVRAGDSNDYDILKPTAPYVKKKKIRYDDEEKFSKPIRERKQIRERVSVGAQFVNRLAPYPIPREVQRLSATNEYEAKWTIDQMFRRDDSNEVDMEDDTIDYSSFLTCDNYARCMQHLLWLEEAQMKVDIKTYDLSSVPLIKEGRCYKLHVPGLAESRPSVLKGDRIFINANGKQYEAIVSRCSQECAYMNLPRKFESVYLDGLRVDVRFTFSRTTLRTSHQALMVMSPSTNDDSSLLTRTIFPQLLDNSPRVFTPLNTHIIRTNQLNFYNRALNEEQQTAVVGIVHSVARPSPYLIYGPPGTGKTVTLVESILQTLLAQGSNPNTKILIVAPSNSAVDVVVERLSEHVRPCDMFRLMAFSRDKASVPEKILEYTKYNEEENCFSAPDPITIKEYKIVAATISYAGRLPNNGIVDHFTHVFVDEAGHSVESETLGCLAQVTTQRPENPPAIVLAGDPKQLGPIIRSDIAKKFGLEKSMLERLSEMEPYARREDVDVLGNHYDKRMITKLIHNYRSHPTILDLPNKEFYDGDLIAAADITRSHRFVGWEHLPTPNKFPIIFHGVEGEDMREANSPSWFNPDEAQFVKMYVDLLINETRKNKCKAEDIGIITPYHRQVQKIRKLLDAHGHFGCKVGSVEEFQGSEKPVIIISTVRSTVDHISFDQKHKLGFLANEKRFNVAITRAQALLIIIGNPFTLEKDIHWQGIIDHAIDGGGYTGVEYTKKEQRVDDQSAIEDVISGIKATSLDDEDSDDDGGDFVVVSHVTAQEGPAWRTEL